MPIYEYKCQTCGHEYEELVAASAEPPTCPECNGNAKRQLSATASPTTTSLPDATGHGCCGHHPGQKGCVPGSCCGKA